MTFKFSLQKVLELRDLQTNEAQRQVDGTLKAIHDLKDLLESQRQLYFAERDSLNIAVRASQFNDVIIYENSLMLRQQRMMELLKNLKFLQSELDMQQATLVATKKNKKMIEKIHDLKKKDYEKIENAQDQRLMDEIAVQRFLKSKWEEQTDEE